MKSHKMFCILPDGVHLVMKHLSMPLSLGLTTNSWFFSQAPSDNGQINIGTPAVLRLA